LLKPGQKNAAISRAAAGGKNLGLLKIFRMRAWFSHFMYKNFKVHEAFGKKLLYCRESWGGTEMKDQDFLSIREFSKLTGVKQSTLRHYDEIKLFRPVRRGENGYRYYSASQTIMVNCLNVLKSLRIPVKKVFEFRDERTPEQILEFLKEQEMELNQELFRLQQAYALIHTYTRMIQEGLLADENEIKVQKMTETPIELGSVNDFSSGFFYESFFKFIKKISVRKIDSAYPIGGYYDAVDDFYGAPGQPTRFFSLVPTGHDSKKAGDYLVGYSRGYYGEIGDLPERMQEYAKKNKLTLRGPVYEIYLHDEISHSDPDKYLIQISIPVVK